MQVPREMAAETRTAFSLLALTVPLVVVGSGLRGVLEAERRFAAVAALRAALGLVSFLGPLAVVPFAPVSTHGAPGWIATTVVGTSEPCSAGDVKLRFGIDGLLPARSATSLITTR